MAPWEENMRSVITLAAVTLLAGCSTSHFLTKSADFGKESLLTDAKQRVVLSVPRDSDRIICAEPSPDVAQALSDAIRAGLALDLGKATGDTKALSADFGKSSAASVAQLGERLAVVQLLRDRMYRACEAYANRAIGEAAYTLLMARNDKTMMSLLTNELAAGAFGRSLATIGGSALVGGISAADLEAQKKKVKDKSDALVKASTAETPNKDDIKKLAGELEVEVAKLAALERGSTSSSANAASGSIAGSQTREAHVMADIHRAYLDDDGVDPLIDACIIGVEKMHTKSPEARSYIQSIATRAEADRARAAEVSRQMSIIRAQISDERSKLAQLSGELAEAEGRTPSAPPSGGGSVVLFSPNYLRALMTSSKERIDAANADLKSLADERASLLKTPGLQAEDLYLATQSPFAAFCFQSVLAGDSKFMNLRMQQKRKLRGLDIDDDVLTGKQLDVCAAVLKADKASMDGKVRDEMLSGCAGLMKKKAAFEPKPVTQ